MTTVIVILLSVSFLTMLIPMLVLDDPDWKHLSLITSVICLMWATLVMSTEEYKKGQIDAMNGDIKYEMKVDTSTTVDTTYIKKDD